MSMYIVEGNIGAGKSTFLKLIEDSLSQVYQTFSKRFMDFVEVLNYISEKSTIQADHDVLRLYDRYLRTGSELAREKLNELGVVIVPKEQLKHTMK